MGPSPFTPDPLGGTWPAPFPWLSFGFTGDLPGYSITTVVEPQLEPVDRATAKLQANVDYDDKDALFDLWIPAARRLVEKEAETALVTQTLLLQIPGWPANGQVRLPVGPAVSVDFVKYYDAGGTLQTLTEGTDFQTWLAYRPPLVLPYPQKYWPVVQFARVPAVQVQYQAGFGATPAAIASGDFKLAKAAILMTIGYWDRNRGDEEAPQKFGLPEGAVRLIGLMSTKGYR